MKLFVFLLASIISAAVAGTYNGYETPDYTVLEEVSEASKNNISFNYFLL